MALPGLPSHAPPLRFSGLVGPARIPRASPPIPASPFVRAGRPGPPLRRRPSAVTTSPYRPRRGPTRRAARSSPLRFSEPVGPARAPGLDHGGGGRLRSAPLVCGAAAGVLPCVRPAPSPPRFSGPVGLARIPEPYHQSPRRPSCTRAGRARCHAAPGLGPPDHCAGPLPCHPPPFLRRCRSTAGGRRRALPGQTRHLRLRLRPPGAAHGLVLARPAGSGSGSIEVPFHHLLEAMLARRWGPRPDGDGVSSPCGIGVEVH